MQEMMSFLGSIEKKKRFICIIQKKVIPLHANCVPSNNRIVIPLTPTG